MNNTDANLLKTIDGYIKSDKLNEAINTLFEFDEQAQVNIRKDLMMIAASHQQATNMWSNHLIDEDKFLQEVARVRFALLNLVETMPVRIQLNAPIKELAGNSAAENERSHLFLPVNWLEKALMASKAVCRVVLDNGSMGTGFLTREGYLFTCNHIINSVDTANTTRIELNFEVGFDGKAKLPVTYQLDASDFKSSPPRELDFTRVKVIDRAEAPLKQWGFVEFEPDAIPAVGADVAIIQHPNGGDKQVAFHSSRVLNQYNQHLFYTTNTAPGSAGSPVFNIDWKVVAIHHAGKTEESGGFVINAKGERRGGKRGILFRDIFALIGE